MCCHELPHVVSRLKHAFDIGCEEHACIIWQPSGFASLHWYVFKDASTIGNCSVVTAVQQLESYHYNVAFPDDKYGFTGQLQ